MTEPAPAILGVQACLWTELIATPEEVEYMLFPRLLAVAEVAWAPPQRRPWNAFARRLPARLQELARRGLHFRNPFTYGDSDREDGAAPD